MNRAYTACSADVQPGTGRLALLILEQSNRWRGFMNKATQKLLCAHANRALWRSLATEQPSAYEVLVKLSLIDHLRAPTPRKAPAPVAQV